MRRDVFYLIRRAVLDGMGVVIFFPKKFPVYAQYAQNKEKKAKIILEIPAITRGFARDVNNPPK